jgi:Flp pilus assembly pilin Flp
MAKFIDRFWAEENGSAVLDWTVFVGGAVLLVIALGATAVSALGAT